jgi:hypothetical protein
MYYHKRNCAGPPFQFQHLCQCGRSGMFISDPGCDFFPSRIPDPNCLYPGSRILIKEFKYFNPKKAKKWLLSSKKYDPGCLSPIPDPDADFLPSLIQGSKRHPIPDPESESATLIRVSVSDLYIPRIGPHIFLQKKRQTDYGNI